VQILGLASSKSGVLKLSCTFRSGIPNSGTRFPNYGLLGRNVFRCRKMVSGIWSVCLCVFSEIFRNHVALVDMLQMGTSLRTAVLQYQQKKRYACCSSNSKDTHVQRMLNAFNAFNVCCSSKRKWMIVAL
jgi:hypothetical protein